MLLVSYIATAGLELALVMMMVQQDLNTLLWSYGFLLLSSLISIPVETSDMGKVFRKQLKEMNIHIDWYDLISNGCRVVIYLLVILGPLDAYFAVVMAYAVIVVGTFLAMRKLT